MVSPSSFGWHSSVSGFFEHGHPNHPVPLNGPRSDSHLVKMSQRIKIEPPDIPQIAPFSYTAIEQAPMIPYWNSPKTAAPPSVMNRFRTARGRFVIVLVALPLSPPTFCAVAVTVIGPSGTPFIPSGSENWRVVPVPVKSS